MKKPPDADPIARPWLFVAESLSSQPEAQRGSDQLKFIRRETPRSSEGPASDVAMVAYTLRRSEDGASFELRRWSTSELPPSLDREYPRSDDPASLIVADDLSYFALRFLDENGEWKSRWDSTLMVDSSELPIAVEIEVALAAPDTAPGSDTEPTHYARAVQLPLRPIDLEALLNPGDSADLAKTQVSELTVADCIDFSRIGEQSIPGFSASDIATFGALVQQNPDALFSPYARALKGHPAVNPDCR